MIIRSINDPLNDPTEIKKPCEKALKRGLVPFAVLIDEGKTSVICDKMKDNASFATRTCRVYYKDCILLDDTLYYQNTSAVFEPVRVIGEY